jgi:hypothetical protein
VIVLLWHLACTTPRDPEGEALEASLDAWEGGMAALEDGRPADARTSFESARRSRPDDPLLFAWEAHAAARAGDLDGAIALLDRALEQDPGFVEARYNRAAYLARAGRPEDAAVELERAFAGGLARTPLQVVDDPDFARWRDHAAFAEMLPADTLAVAVEGPKGTVFRDHEFELRMRVLGAGTDPVGVSAERASGPVTLVQAIEDEVPSNEGPHRDVVWRLRATGAGTVQLGPFLVVAGSRTVRADAWTGVVGAPPDRTEADPAPLPWFTTPRELADRMQIGSARRTPDGVVVKAAPGERCEITPAPASGPYRYELRASNDLVWFACLWPGAAEGSRVWLVRGGGKVEIPVAP